MAFFQIRNPGCDESGQGQRGGTQRGWKETQCTTLPPMPSNLTLPCRDQMGQLGLDTRWKFDLRMPSAREPGGLEPVEGPVASPITHFSLKGNPTGAKQPGGSQSSQFGRSACSLLCFESRWHPPYTPSRAHQRPGFLRAHTSILFSYPGLGWAYLLSRALGGAALSKRWSLTTRVQRDPGQWYW